MHLNPISKRIAVYTFLLFLIVSLVNCSEKPDENTDAIIAKAYDKVLYLSEIEELFGPNMTRQDSIMIEKGYIDAWLRKQVILNYANENGIGTSDEITKKVEDFKFDLISFSARKNIIAQYLDTNIRIDEMKKYYDDNPESFELKQNIIRCVFIKMPDKLDEHKKKNYWNKFKKGQETDVSEMAVDALKNGGTAYLEKENWLAFDEMLKVVPITTYNQENFINSNRVFRVSDQGFVWYVNIFNFRIKDHISPFEFVKDNIQQILLNKRKIELLKKIENEMVLQAEKEDKINVYPTQKSKP
ncbi:MAG: hypothetical protein H6605_06955 [Flavobacteriales bacterium]|nr:hypothetical protein [Flavobacteriales bacterium]